MYYIYSIYVCVVCVCVCLYVHIYTYAYFYISISISVSSVSVSISTSIYNLVRSSKTSADLLSVTWRHPLRCIMILTDHLPL